MDIKRLRICTYLLLQNGIAEHNYRIDNELCYCEIILS